MLPGNVRAWAMSAMTGGALNLPGVFVGNPVMADIPPVAVAAYILAAADVNEVRQTVDGNATPCPIDWRIIAAIGKAESNHGRFGGATLDARGNLTRPVISGAGAEGVTQFMPDTLAYYRATYDLDANRDGVEDPNNVFDAARATAVKLCGDGVIADPDNAAGVYNGGANWPQYAESRNYVAVTRDYRQTLPEFDARTLTPIEKNRTLAGFLETWWQRLVVFPWIKLRDSNDSRYQAKWDRWDAALFGSGGQITNPPEPAPGSPRPDKLDPTFGASLDNLIVSAPGTITVTSGYRSPAEQQYARNQNCPDPINSPTEDCTPHTVPAGNSDHNKGLAADLAFDTPATEQWAHSHADEFGLAFTDPTEAWHIALRRFA